MTPQIMPVMAMATTDVEDPRWLSIQRRDARQDGRFVYAVRTTGVYCRPSCPSRSAKRENVCFFATPGEAEQAGYRACRRCHPNGASVAESQAAMVAEACRLMDEAEEPLKLAELAGRLGLSPFHLQRVFSAAMGVSPKAYGDARRAERLRESLASGQGSVTRAGYEAGFNSSGRLYAQAGAALGMTPRRYRKGGEAATIRFALAQTALGTVLVACSAQGICAISLGDDPELLLRELQDRFPKAELVGGDTAFEAEIAAVIGLVEAPGKGSALALPLDLRGTAFQQRVWQALRAIPPGQTRSYAEVAQAIGAPKAVRAVAQACARNHIAIAIPCHRVVRQDGGISGYRWGVARKQALLAKEAQ